MRPCKSVRVGFWSFCDYDNACAAFGGAMAYLERWQDLGDLLAHRPGWYFEIVNDGEALWNLGLLGASRLNIQVHRDGTYACFEHSTGSGDNCASIAAVEEWLAGREERASRLTEAQKAWVRGDDWALLKAHSFQVQASWSDGSYQVSLPALYDVAFGGTLTAAVKAAAEMICRLHEAPLELAPQLTMKVELDESATRQLRQA